jgi:hypothetical protein
MRFLHGGLLNETKFSSFLTANLLTYNKLRLMDAHITVTISALLLPNRGSGQSLTFKQHVFPGHDCADHKQR